MFFKKTTVTTAQNDPQLRGDFCISVHHSVYFFHYPIHYSALKASKCAVPYQWGSLNRSGKWKPGSKGMHGLESQMYTRGNGASRISSECIYELIINARADVDYKTCLSWI